MVSTRMSGVASGQVGNGGLLGYRLFPTPCRWWIVLDRLTQALARIRVIAASTCGAPSWNPVLGDRNASVLSEVDGGILRWPIVPVIFINPLSTTNNQIGSNS